MDQRRIFRVVEGSAFVVIGVIFFMTFSFADPGRSLGRVFMGKHVIFLGFIYIFLFLVFRVIEHYHQQLDRALSHMRKLSDDFVQISAQLKLDGLCSEVISMLTDFYRGRKGILLVTEPALRKYVTTDVFYIQRSAGKKCHYPSFRYKMFSPAQVPAVWDEKIRLLIQEYELFSCPSISVVPFISDGNTKLIGIIGTEETDRRFYGEINDAVSVFIRQINALLENSLLHEEVHEASLTDPLTRLFNRRYFQARMKEMFAEAKRRNFPVTVMISDIDKFKFCVDTYGHPKGDEVLTDLADRVKKTMRTSDVVCRFGGDEFSYLLPYTGAAEAKLVAERVREAVARKPFLEKEERPFNATLSIGMATYPEHGESEEDIVRKADNALFAAKEKGRNMVVAWHAQPELFGDGASGKPKVEG